MSIKMENKWILRSKIRVLSMTDYLRQSKWHGLLMRGACSGLYASTSYSENEVDDYLWIRDVRFAYSNLCASFTSSQFIDHYQYQGVADKSLHLKKVKKSFENS